MTAKQRLKRLQAQYPEVLWYSTSEGIRGISAEGISLPSEATVIKFSSQHWEVYLDHAHSLI